MLRKFDKPAQEVPQGTVNAEDVALIERVVAGDLRAFETLYRSYFPRLTRFLDRMMRRPELVEEVLNDTMLVVARNAQKYNHASKVSTWIFAIAYRKALKALRDVNDPVDLDGSLDDLLGPDQREPKA